MNTETVETPRKEDIILINRLEKLLEEQINIIHHSDITGKKVEAHAEQMKELVKEAAARELLALEQFKEHREHIKRLYNNLCLAVIARKDETEKHLNKIRKGKKTIGAYRGNI